MSTELDKSLLEAVRSNNVDLVEKIVTNQRSPIVFSLGDFKNTITNALHMSRNKKITDLLLSNSESNLLVVVDNAAEKNYWNVVDLVIDYGLNLGIYPKKKVCANILLGAVDKNLKLLEYLLKKYCGPTEKTLVYAIQQLNPEAVQLLLYHKAKPTQKSLEEAREQRDLATTKDDKLKANQIIAHLMDYGLGTN